MKLSSHEVFSVYSSVHIPPPWEYLSRFWAGGLGGGLGVIKLSSYEGTFQQGFANCNCLLPSISYFLLNTQYSILNTHSPLQPHSTFYTI